MTLNRLVEGTADTTCHDGSPFLFSIPQIISEINQRNLTGKREMLDSRSKFQ